MAKTSEYMTISPTMRYIISYFEPEITHIRRIYGQQTKDNLCFIHSLKFICQVNDGFEFFNAVNFENDYTFKRLKCKKLS